MMKLSSILFGGVFAALCLWPLCAPAAPPAKPPAAAQPAAPEPEIPASVFAFPATPKEGRNPFFPRAMPTAQQETKARIDPLDPGAFKLKGITSPPKRTATINDRTFELNETAELKTVAGTKVLVQCVAIGEDSATIFVNGQRYELRLRPRF